MAGSVDPGTQRHRLGRELRLLREQKNLTQGEVAKKFEWSLTKIIRIEKGMVSLSITDLRALLDLYEEGNDQKAIRLMDLARSGHGQSWSDQYRDVISYEYARYLALEGSASALSAFHPYLIPGLLQTEDYAAVLADSHQESEQNHRMVDLRVQRQNRLLADWGENEPPMLTFLLSEEALHRAIGGPAVMVAQLRHLRELSERPNVELAVIPYSAGAHPGLLGSSILLRMADDERAVFNEGSAEGLTEDPAKITKAIVYFETMGKLALPADETAELIGEMIERFASQANHGAAGAPTAAVR